MNRHTHPSVERLSVLVLVLTGPFLLAANWFPRPLSVVALGVIVLPFLVRFRVTGQFSRYTPANLLVTLIAVVFLPMAALLTPSLWAITWSHVTTLAWSIALFFTIINRPYQTIAHEQYWADRFNPTWLYILSGGLVAMAGILGMRNVEKLFSVPITGALSDWFGSGSGLATNEIAGVLTLFVPFTAAMAFGIMKAGRRRISLALIFVLLVMLFALVLTQSRTGMMAVAVGVLIVIVVSARPNRKTLLIVLGVGAGVVILAVITGLLDRFIFAGANSWASVVGPRMGIWQQASDALGDHSLWGMGFGIFGQAVALVYPLLDPMQATILEDAHNLYLQTMLDFGVIGGIVFFLLLLVTLWTSVRLLKKQPRGSLAYLWVAGLLASLVAHMLYSVTDAVALGTAGGVALWYLLGLIMSQTNRPQKDTLENFNPIIWFGGLAVAGVVLSLWLWFALPVNRAGQLATRKLLNPNEASVAETAAIIQRLAEQSCRAYWFEGLVYQSAGENSARSEAWADLSACTDRYTRYMAVAAANDAALARRSLQLQPANADAHFWLAAAIAGTDPSETITLLRQGLALAPNDGRRWQMLGDLLVAADPQSAEQAYYMSCTNGDPGANGCWRAGGVAESRGDIPKAIYYYRLSNFKDAQQKADLLESRLTGSEQSN